MSESGHIIALQAQSYYAPGLPKDFCIISSQGICASEEYKGTFIAHCINDNDSYEEKSLKEDNPGCQEAKPVESVYVNYYQKNNLPNHEDILLIQIERMK